jgi:hypothetical protein
MLTLESEPNIYSVWLAVLGIIGSITAVLAPVLAFWLYKKLGAIHTLVNGNLHTALKKVDELRSKVVDLGGDPDA